MNIASSAFTHNGNVPSKYTCDGANISPPLEFSNVPEEAQSLVLIVDDPDAPAKTWVHWLVWNIDPTSTGTEEGTVPSGLNGQTVEGTTDFGQTGYGGPCPPSGIHRYFFKLYALNAKLDLDASATKPDLEVAMEGHIIDQAELIGLYERGD
ncbi:MAG: YbhB/YbcL family Raf kinase inhibitor-like protein [Candidatus Gracilibacteria bacterium]